MSFMTKYVSYNKAAMSMIFCRFHHILKLLADTEEGQIWLLRTMFEVWSSHQQVKCLYIYLYIHAFRFNRNSKLYLTVAYAVAHTHTSALYW